MKIFIIGIDALEYDLVEKYDLKNLKQEEYGKVIVPINKKTNSPVTPQVWASFLTGEIQDANFEEKSENQGFLLIYQLLGYTKRFFNPGWGIMHFLHRKMKIHKDFSRLNSTTFLERCNSDYYNIPFYDFSKNDIDYFFKMDEYLSGRINLNSYRNYLIKSFKNIKSRIILKLKKSHADLFFCYFHNLDYVQHFFFHDLEFLQESYKAYDNLIGKIRKKFDPYIILIISDHGQKKGMHTNYGFYSLNKKMDIGNPRMTDFYNLFMNQLNLPTLDEEEKVKDHLKKLGYF